MSQETYKKLEKEAQHFISQNDLTFIPSLGNQIQIAEVNGRV